MPLISAPQQMAYLLRKFVSSRLGSQSTVHGYT